MLAGMVIAAWLFALTAYAVKGSKTKNIAIIADTTGYGEAGLKDVEAALAARQLKPVYVARFATGVKDLGPELQAARQAGANVIVAGSAVFKNDAAANTREFLEIFSQYQGR